MSDRLDAGFPGASPSRIVRRLRQRFLHLIVPLSAAVGRLHLPYTRKRVRAAHVREALGLLKPGHIFRTRSDGDLVNLFVPGDSQFRHTAIWDGEGVIEASGGGVVRLDIHDFLMSKDRFQLLEPRWATEALMTEAARQAGTLVGQPYDMIFRLSGDGQYCFKLPYDCYRRALGARPPMTLRRHWAEEVVVSDTYDRGFRVLGEWPPRGARYVPFFTPKLEFAATASEPVEDNAADAADAGEHPAPRRRPLRSSLRGLARISLGVPLLLLGMVSLLVYRTLRRGGR
jgi:hypothetical protein